MNEALWAEDSLLPFDVSLERNKDQTQTANKSHVRKFKISKVLIRGEQVRQWAKANEWGRHLQVALTRWVGEQQLFRQDSPPCKYTDINGGGSYDISNLIWAFNVTDVGSIPSLFLQL